MPSKVRCSRLLNKLRLERGALVEYAELRAAVWPEYPQPKRWKSQLCTFVFWLREMGYPVVTEYGRGLRFQPAQPKPPIRQQRPARAQCQP